MKTKREKPLNDKVFTGWMIFLAGAMFLFFAQQGQAISQDQFCAGLGLDLNTTKDYQDCQQYWSLITNSSVQQNVVQVNNNLQNESYYTKEQVDLMIEQIKTAEKDKEIEELKAAIESFKNPNAAATPEETAAAPLTKEELTKTIQETVKFQMMANDPTGAASAEFENGKIVAPGQQSPGLLASIPIWMYLMAAALLGIVGWKQGWFNQKAPPIPGAQHQSIDWNQAGMQQEEKLTKAQIQAEAKKLADQMIQGLKKDQSKKKKKPGESSSEEY